MSDLINRLRGQYQIGPNGEYGIRDFASFIPPIALEAADEIERLNARVKELETVEAAIRQDQIGKDEKEFIHLLDAMIESTTKNFTDSMIPVQQLNSVKGQVEAAAAYRNYFSAIMRK